MSLCPIVQAKILFIALLLLNRVEVANVFACNFSQPKRCI